MSTLRPAALGFRHRALAFRAFESMSLVVLAADNLGVLTDAIGILVDGAGE